MNLSLELLAHLLLQSLSMKLPGLLQSKIKKIVLKYFNRTEDIRFCNILFIAQKQSYSLQSILDEVGKGVFFTISEEEGYCKQGTAFNFVIVNDKLKFEANLKAIDDAGLKASSQLLKLAIIVN